MPRVSGFKTVSAAAYNRKAADHFLKIAKSTEEGRFYTAKASLIFSAFTHEAFLNSLGEKLIPFGVELDRLSVAKKLKVISSQIEYAPNLGTRPYQTLRGLFRFRNSMAHGRDKTVREDDKKVVDSGPGANFDAISTTWESYCTVDNAAMAFDDVEAIAKDLCDRAGVERFAGYPFGTLGAGSYRVDED